jgi:hypothetical protein
MGVVSFTPQPLYCQGKSPWYPLDRRLGGPQSGSGRSGEVKNKITIDWYPQNVDIYIQSNLFWVSTSRCISIVQFPPKTPPPPFYSSHLGPTVSLWFKTPLICGLYLCKVPCQTSIQNNPRNYFFMYLNLYYFGDLCLQVHMERNLMVFYASWYFPKLNTLY